jgi:hypothetical protein
MGSKFVFLILCRRHGGANFKAERGGGAPKRLEDLIRSSDAAQTPVFDYWGGTRHASNVTRGRRLGPEENHLGGPKEGKLSCRTQVDPQGGDPSDPRCRPADRRVGEKGGCERKFFQVKFKGQWGYPRKTKGNCMQQGRKREKHEVGWALLLRYGQRGPAHKG